MRSAMSGTLMPGFWLDQRERLVGARVATRAGAASSCAGRGGRSAAPAVPRRPGPLAGRTAGAGRRTVPVGFTPASASLRLEQGQILFVRRLQLLQSRLDLLALLGQEIGTGRHAVTSNVR